MPGLSNRLRIVVLGYIVRGPIGGMAWHHLHYVLGLKELGHDVLFLEDSDDYPSCYDPSRHVVDADPRYGLAFAETVFRRLGLDESWAYHDAHTHSWHGPAGAVAVSYCQSADLMLNVSGVNPLRPWTAAIERRAFIDTDPLFTQIRHLTDGSRRELAAQHNRHFTFGESIGMAECTIPADGFHWRPTRQPIAIKEWPSSKGPENGPFTTIMQWDSYPPVERGGELFGMKSHSFGHFASLTHRVREPLELALGGNQAPREQLRTQGWHIVNPLQVARDPWSYQNYITESKAEFSIAKHGYVRSRCGWFSERSACYLAAGRPVVVQETGFSNHLPAGQGLLAFSDVDSAAAAIEEVAARYDRHALAARDICEAHFNSAKVLDSLIERCMN